MNEISWMKFAFPQVLSLRTLDIAIQARTPPVAVTLHVR
jgi:hypothetical protein